jgi:hypothetical protein
MAVYTVSFKQLLDGYAVLQTLTPNEIEVDRPITVAGVGAPFNGTFTVYALPQYEYVGLDGEGNRCTTSISLYPTRCCLLLLAMT